MVGKWKSENGFRVCSACETLKPFCDYYLRENGSPNGRVCKVCRRNMHRVDSMLPDRREKRLKRQAAYNEKNKEKHKTYLSDYYKSFEGRAKSLMKSIKRRSSKFQEKCDFDEQYILDLLKSQKRCSVTNLEFDYSSGRDTTKNPYAPSVDRINPKVGYIKSNIRIVIWQFNLMKGELSDDEILKICKEVVGGNL